MALIKCPECGKEVSDTSYKCPNCGFVLNEPKRSITGNIFRVVFITFNGIMLLTLLAFFFGVNQIGDDSGSSAAAGALGTGMLFIIWVIVGLPLGIMSYITRAKSGN